MAADAGRPVVEAVGLWAEFASGDGVGPVDLELRAGERVLVLGPSGSGKSTLLRLLHGAVPHAISAEVGGTVHVAGRDVGDASVAQLADAVGVVAQDPESGVCLPDVDDETAFPLENLGRDPGAIGPAVARALEAAGAAALAGRRTAELSGGELQRVALAAAIAAEPQVLLLDEPTSMLDAAGIDAVRDAVETARRTTGAACVLVEHRLDELAGEQGSRALPERWIVVGRDGRIRHDVRARELTDEALRELVAEGCWLPLDLEMRALFGVPGVADAAERGDGVDAAITVSLQGAILGERPPFEPSDTRNRTLKEHHSTRSGEPGTLTAQNVTLARGPRRARIPVLEHIDLELRTGETVALLGANGTGKSTLLRVLAGLARPDAGRIEGPRAGMVFQNPEHQFAALTVRAELAHGLPEGEATDARVDEQLRRFGLQHVAEHSPYRLSGGQKRRVSLAAMLLHDRRFLVADEPTFGLDRHAQITAMRALRAAADEGRGVCFSSHDLRAVATYADRVIVLGDRRVLADTTPAGLVRDRAALDAAGLRVPRLVRELAARTDDEHVTCVLRAIDDRTLALGGGPGLGPDSELEHGLDSKPGSEPDQELDLALDSALDPDPASDPLATTSEGAAV